MNTQDELKKERRMLERLEKSYKARLPEWERKLENARKNSNYGTGYAASQTLAAVQEQFDLWKGMHNQNVEEVKQHIQSLEATVKENDLQIQKQGRAQLNGQKEKAQATWLQSGGSQEAFNAAWPDIEKDILKQRAVEALKEPTAD